LFICSVSSLKIATKVEVVSRQADPILTRIDALEANFDALIAQFKNFTASSSSSSSGSGSKSNTTNYLRDYMYKDAIIYQDIFHIYDQGIIQKRGSPKGWDETSYVSTKWNQRNILNIGAGANANGVGLKVNIPPNYDVLWIRVLNDRWAVFKVCPLTSDDQTDFPASQYERYASGFRNLNSISPDGAAPDSQWNLHMWVPIPIRGGSGTKAYMVQSDVNSDDWISGIAFGKNIWNHAVNTAIAYSWALGGGIGTTYMSPNWNNDMYAVFAGGSDVEVFVPVVYSGKDKMIYLVEFNNNWTGTQHTAVYVNGKKVERFRTSWSNPFARHHNSKIYCRYMATRIPAKMVKPNDLYIAVRVDMTENGTDMNLNFREMGTHDYN